MPILEHVVEQHAEEAAFLWLLRDDAVAAPHYRLADCTELDARVEAHLDGLRLAGDAAWSICRERALATAEPGEVFAAAVLAFEGADGARVEELLRVAEQSPAAFRGLVSALGWVPEEKALAWVRPMISARSNAYRRLGIAGFAITRHDPEAAFAGLLADADAAIRARALRAAGELRKREVATALESHAHDADEAVRFWAAWSGVLLGVSSARRRLCAFVRAGRSFASRAVALALRGMPPGDAHDLLKELGSRGETRRYALIGCGVVGDPLYVPTLLKHMSVPEHARVAGEAFSMITGVDLAYEDLEGGPPEGFEAGPTEDPDDEDVGMDPDEDLPWPDPTLVQSWWNAHGRAFAPGQRYLCGRVIDEECCRRVLSEGYQRQRIAAAYELALMRPHEPLFEWRAPGFRQRLGSGTPRR